MREKPDKFFLRQNVSIKAKPRPSNDKNVIRLKFMEKPYIWYKRLPSGIRLGWKAIAYSVVVPYVLYQMILFFVRYDHKAKLKAALGDDNAIVYERMKNLKLA